MGIRRAFPDSREVFRAGKRLLIGSPQSQRSYLVSPKLRRLRECKSEFPSTPAHYELVFSATDFTASFFEPRSQNVVVIQVITLNDLSITRLPLRRSAIDQYLMWREMHSKKTLILSPRLGTVATQTGIMHSFPTEREMRENGEDQPQPQSQTNFGYNRCCSDSFMSSPCVFDFFTAFA